MFYELIYEQLNISEEKRVRILDFGAGFCITANHYAKNHEVVAVEPNEEMYSLRIEKSDYTLIRQGLDYLKTVPDNSVDVAICHNVLEYAEEKEEILKQLVRILKPEGILSVIKHNLLGRVMGSAVLGDNPKAALDLLNDVAEDSMFGNRSVYSNQSLIDALSENMVLIDLYGIRAFFGLSSNNEIKFTDEWYQAMLELEIVAGESLPFADRAGVGRRLFERFEVFLLRKRRRADEQEKRRNQA